MRTDSPPQVIVRPLALGTPPRRVEPAAAPRHATSWCNPGTLWGGTVHREPYADHSWGFLSQQAQSTI